MYRPICLLLCLTLVTACISTPPEPGIGAPVPWNALDGWDNDRLTGTWPAFLRSCSRIGAQARWRDVCANAQNMSDPDEQEIRSFFRTRFRPHPVDADNGRRRGLITGYYQPVLRGSLKPGGRYRYPLYRPPDDLLRISLGDAYPELAGKSLRGRLQDGIVMPYPDRARLESSPDMLAGAEIVWVDDPIDAFFLHIQGSGRIRLPDGGIVALGFADHNGRTYRSIGRRLIETGALERDAVSLFTIRRWLRDHPEQARDVLNHNPRYVFFRLRQDALQNPVGSLGVSLTPGRSLAVDREHIPLGAPIWLETTMPGDTGAPLKRLMVAQDTGGAIRGRVRADIYWGTGKEAERNAGLMKNPGRMYVLLPVNTGK